MSTLASGISSRLVNLGQGWCAVGKAGLRAGTGATLIAINVYVIAKNIFFLVEGQPMIYSDCLMLLWVIRDPLCFAKGAEPHFIKMQDAWKVARSHFQQAWSPTPPTLSQRIKMWFRS